MKNSRLLWNNRGTFRGGILVFAGFVVLCVSVILVVNTVLVTFSSVVKSSDENYAFLIMGTDTGGMLSNGDRTDFIVSASIGNDGVFEVTSIPRDTIVSWNNEEHRINVLYKTFGVEAISKTVENLTGKKIMGYAVIDFSTVASLTEFTGPIKVNIQSPMNYDDYQQNLHIHFPTGVSFLEGEELLEYIRFRYDKYGDLGRIQRQKEVIRQLVNRIISSGTSEMLGLATFLSKQIKMDLDYLPIINSGIRFITGSRDMVFGEIPYTIDENGRIIPIENSENKDITGKKPLSILVVNNIPGYEKTFGSFSSIVSDQWLKRSEIRIDACPEILDLPVEKNQTWIFVNSRDEELLAAFKKSHPFHSARVVTAGSDPNSYFALIDILSKLRYYSTGYDGIVLLGTSDR